MLIGRLFCSYKKWDKLTPFLTWFLRNCFSIFILLLWCKVIHQTYHLFCPIALLTFETVMIPFSDRWLIWWSRLIYWLGWILIKLLWKKLLFLRKLYAVSKGRIDNSFKHFFDSFNDIFAILTCIDNPTDSLLKLFTSSFGFVIASLAVKIEHFLNNSQDIN